MSCSPLSPFSFVRCTVGHLKFLVYPYKAGMYYFEAIECVRRLCLACAVGLFDGNSAVSPTTGLLVCISFIWVSTHFKPYKASTDNSLGVILQFSLTLLFLAALMIKVDVSSDYSKDSQAFGNILLVVLAAGPIGIAYNLFSETVFMIIGTILQMCMIHKAVNGQQRMATEDEALGMNRSNLHERMSKSEFDVGAGSMSNKLEEPTSSLLSRNGAMTSASSLAPTSNASFDDELLFWVVEKIGVPAVTLRSKGITCADELTALTDEELTTTLNFTKIDVRKLRDRVSNPPEQI
jgi:hypothetical protein